MTEKREREGRITAAKSDKEHIKEFMELNASDDPYFEQGFSKRHLKCKLYYGNISVLEIDES